VTNLGKRFLAVLFILANVGCIFAFIIASDNHDEAVFNHQLDRATAAYEGTGSGGEPPYEPNPYLYGGGAALLLVGAFVMFNGTSNDRQKGPTISPTPLDAGEPPG
jgi:hypothetical protein